MLRKGEWVWLDTGTDVPIGAKLKVTPSGQRLLVDDVGKEHHLFPEQEASLKIMHPTSVEGVDDMIRLGDMTEAGLLRNLQLRHKRGIIYTYTGSVLVAVNPYQFFPIYSNDQVRLYHGKKLGQLPPHIFALAESCYFNMKRYFRNQCCIISGESGAGKTESTKLIVQYLAAISGERSEQQIEKQILESNPILEGFGNAKTIRNDNSSRFGKYLEIIFNDAGAIEGARVEQYLLEKSRVCHQAKEERNYHIFYCMLAGITAEEKKHLGLQDANGYKFLIKGECMTCEGRDDAEDFKRIRSAMKILTFSDQQCYEIFKLLAAILHLGNVYFEGKTQNYLETSDVSKSENFNTAASLLEVKNSVLAKCLTHHSLMTKRERVTKPLDCEQASACRDAFVKAIYNKLFIWIVEKINDVVHKRISDSPKSQPHLSIGLLDIFGFENFQINSFEQLCINFANEKLQQFFVGHIFKLEQKEYLKEQIMWNTINFVDNHGILELLAGKPCNLLALIDEESHFPKGSDLTMLSKMNQQHHGDKAYIPPKSEHDTDFGIHHFAGIVFYESKGFLEKNRDAVSTDIFKMLDMSTNKLLQRIFTSELSTNGVNMTNKRVMITPNNSIRSVSNNRKQVPTLSGQFRKSLDTLMKALTICQPYFIRCFKPNNNKLSEDFDRELCIRQLRCCGMMDTIRIRKLGYAVRHTFAEFLKRYRVLLKTTTCDPKTNAEAACCEAICHTVFTEPDEWKIGKTKIFLKDTQDAVLERLREEELNRNALVIQHFMVGCRHRKSFLMKRRAVMVLQRYWRAYQETKATKKILQGFHRLVSKIRGRKLLFQYQRQHAAAVTLQKHVRHYQARKRQIDAVTLLQAYTRRFLARKLFERMKVEVPVYPDPHTTSEDHETEGDIASALTFRLEKVCMQSEQANEEFEPVIEVDLEDNKSNVLPITALDLKDNKSNISEVDLENNEDNVPLNIEIDLEDNENNVAPIPPLRVTMCEDLESDETEYAETRSEISINASDMTNPTPTPSLEEEEDDFEDFTEDFSFYKFSLLHFQSEMSHTHIKHRLKNPLLQHNDEGDILASLTVWWIILRFMGDLPEPRSPDSTSQVSSLSISRHLPNRQARRLSNLVGLDQKILRKNKKKHGTRKASAILEETENLTEDEDVLIGEGPTLDRPLSSLEKLHIIVGYALSKRGIRDEIYCQICKQLLNNKKQTSCMQGWALLSICLGIFPPTDLFFKYLETFIRKGPNGYAEYCSKRLNRIRANGERKELPSWMEYQASIAKEPIEMTVILTDGSQISLQLDSASTSAEVCQTVADKINLRDTYGFSLYIHLFDKMWSLGSCGKHVFDAVSQCEQEMRRQGRHEKDTPVQLTIRKELFTPWHDCSEDSISTDLIYKQVIQGIKSGEYTCEKDDAYIYLATKHYYIQFGSAYKKENVCKVVEDIIAVPLIEYKSMTKWIQLISEACLQDTYTNGTMSKESVKGELVDSARMDWPVHFSKFYDVTMMSGPLLPKSRFFVAVNWNGIFFMDGRDKKLLECPYLEMREVKKLSEQSVSVATVRGEFVLMCSEADDMNEIVQQNLTGLRARSVFALAEQDFNKTDDPTFLVCKQGDLLMIENQQENSFDKNVVKATNQKTNISGSIYKYALQFLPTLTRPTDEMLELLSPGQRKLSVTQTGAQREETIAPVSLREFALENFRPQDKERLWVCSREPVKQPLMKNLVHNSDLNSLACSAFTSILKYMGDYPIKQVRSPIELTDQIFGPAIQHKLLQDEIYCQIMKQMTNNNNRLSMERGWQLMWLCSGLFPPSQDLLRHAQRFLESRTRQPLATECLQRLKQMRSKEPRKRPPPLVEIDAIQQNSTHIFHKIHFPNDTHDLYEVTSTTTIQELCYSISSQLNLRSPDGYGLYLKTPNKMLSLIEDEYFFDSLREASDISKKGKKVREVSLAYGLIFKRKLWFNVIPGKDLVADLTFHFPQEVPKYLLGYHNCSKDDMIRLGGLLFRAKVDSDRSQFVMIPKMLRDLVPADQIKSLSPEEWKKNIMSSYNKQSGITLDECKIAFLQAISSWPTFGCSFFEVKQMCESSYPSTVLIAISKQGVSLIDPKSKELLVLHPFSRITECHSRGDYFQMTIGTLVKGNIFTCETFQGHTMEDLLRSYVRMYERERQAFQTNKKKVFS